MAERGSDRQEEDASLSTARSPGVAAVEPSPALGTDGARLELYRRGRHHGWLEEHAPPRPREPRELLATWARRWHAGQPIVLPRFVGPLDALAAEIAERDVLRADLEHGGGLLAHLAAHRAGLEPEFEVQGHAPPSREHPLELERVRVTWSPDAARRGPIMRDLWIASARLSAHEDDDSLLIRVGFGHGADDLDRIDLARHRRAAELAGRALPEVSVVQASEELAELLESFAGEPILYTRHAGCWIGQEGGTAFQDGALPADVLGRELASAWVQLAGRTLWLALSLDELAARISAFAASLAGERAWLLEQIQPRPAERERLLEDAREPDRVRAELAKPGCGRLGDLVGRGPEFTAELAAAGHAYLLRPGDVLLLPRARSGRAALGSSFGVDPTPAYGLWLGVRRSEPSPEVAAAWLEERAARRERRDKRGGREREG